MSLPTQTQAEDQSARRAGACLLAGGALGFCATSVAAFGFTPASIVVTLAGLAISALLASGKEASAAAMPDQFSSLDLQLFDSLSIGMFSYSKGRVLTSNAQWARQTSSLEPPWQAIHQDDRDELQYSLDAAEADGKPFSLEFRIIGPEEEELFMECRGLPQVGLSGVTEQVTAFVRDITYLKLAGKQIDERNIEIRSKNAQLRKALHDLEANFEAMIYAFVKAVEAKDPYTGGHSERVMNYSVRMGHELGLSEHEIKVLKLGTLIHDVGKIGMPDSVLSKPGALTPEEFALVKEHPVVGYEMIEGVPLFTECAPIVRWHHERLDGSGYPDGLSGDSISTLVRIATVADVFDALTSNRSYRESMPVERALAILREAAQDGKLDVEIVGVFCRLIEMTELFGEFREQAA